MAKKTATQATYDDARKSIHQSQATLNYIIERFGDVLADQNGFDNLKGIEAIWLYLIRTYHWTPAYVKSMTYEDIGLVLNVEMKGFGFRD